MHRRWEYDALRGLMLVLMTVTHLPTRLSSPLGQPFGFVSAAEGFVLLSAFMAGLVYTARERKKGPDELTDAFMRRALKVYVCQVALLMFLLTVVALIGLVADQPAINNLLGYYRQHPQAALLSGLVLVYAPPLLDILPMYVLFLLMSPIVLLHGLRYGWGLVLGLSTLLWLGAQFGLGAWLYEMAVSVTHLPVPYNQTGAFEVLAWQFLWVLGLWLGSARVTEPDQPVVFPRWAVIAALVYGGVCLLWRHIVGQVPFPGHDDWNLVWSKWQLGPLRVINLFALMVLVIHFAETLTQRLPRLRVLETLGAASLPVFCAHLVLVLLALAFAGEATAERSWWVDIGIVVGSFVVLYVVARLSATVDKAPVCPRHAGAAIAPAAGGRPLIQRREPGPKRPSAEGRPEAAPAHGVSAAPGAA